MYFSLDMDADLSPFQCDASTGHRTWIHRQLPYVIEPVKKE